MSDASEAPVGRLAPSPTGLLHLGHARTFLLAWWHVRARGGRILLRVEDLDTPRVQPELVDALLRDLEWLGLDWDGSVHVQSSGLAHIRAALDRLVAEGWAYACVCTRGDLRSLQSAPQAGDRELRYPGTCRGRFASPAEAESTTGRAAGIRFRVSSGCVAIEDLVRGRVEHDVDAEVGDFLIGRRDGSPAYQLAVVVDDARHGITEVLRGDDLLPSAARQHQLQQALGLRSPRWIHVPLVQDASGRRLAKRAADLSLAELREQGVSPRSIVRWAAESAGQAVSEPCRASEVVPIFDLSQLPREPVKVTPVELDRLKQFRD